MNFDDYDYGGVTNELEENAPIKAPVEFDFTDALGVVKADKWVGANAARRIATINKAFEKIVEQAESDKSRKIAWTPRGEKGRTEAPLFHSDGSWTSMGKEWLGQQRNYLEAAANDETGGLEMNPLSGEVGVATHLAHLLKRQVKQHDPFKDFGSIKQEVESEIIDGKPRDFTYEAFLERVNQGKDPNSPSAIDPDNKALREQFESRKKLDAFDPASMGKTPFVMKEGVPIFNANMLNKPSKIENAIKASELSAADKKMALINFRDIYNKLDANIINEVSDADDMQLHKIGLTAGAAILGIDRNNISKRFRDHMDQSGGKGSMYSFIKENEEEFSGDQFGWADKLNNAFWNASRSTGGGALWLLSGGQSKGVNQFLSDSARSNDSSFEGMGGVEHYRALGMDFTNKGFYDMAGQVLSILATGGGALAIKGGIKAGGTVAGATAGSLVPKVGIAGAMAKGVMASDDAILAATKALAPNTAKNLAIKALRDPSAYIGGLQASGMSFGSTFNQVMEETGDYDLALKKANIAGIASGAAAFIATSVFNRIAPGAEKWMSGVEGSMSQSLVSRLAFAKASSTAASKLGKKEAIEEIAKLSKDETMRKMLSSGIAELMDTSVKKAGLKGYGAAVGMGAEFVEEMTDTILDDVFVAVLDDSVTWTDSVWNNIEGKFSEYMAAGVMGAFGASMAIGIGGVTEFSKKNREARAKAVKEHAFAKWETIKGNVKGFDDKVIVDKDGKYRTVAEFIAWDGATMEEKSKALVNAAFSGVGVKTSLSGAAIAPPAPKAAEATKAAEKAKDNASVLDTILGGKVKDASGKEMEWQDKTEVKVSENKHQFVSGGKVMTIQQVDLPRAEGAGALVTDENGKQTYVKAAEAKKMLEGADPLARGYGFSANPAIKERASMLDKFSIDVEPSNYAKPNETSKQSAASNGNRESEQPPVKKVTGNGPAPETGSNKPVAGVSKVVKTPIDNTGAPIAAAIKAKPGDKLTYSPSDGSAPVEVEFRGWDDSTFDLSGKASKAFVKVGGKDKTVQTSSLSLAPAKEPAAAEVAADPASVNPLTGLLPVSHPDSKKTEAGQLVSEKGHTPLRENAGFSKALDATPELATLANAMESIGIHLAVVEDAAFIERYDDVATAGLIPLSDGSMALVFKRSYVETKSAEVILGTLRHEAIHVAELLYENTPQGAAVTAEAMTLFDQDSSSFDPDLDRIMREEYLGWDKLDSWGKLQETSRAMLEVIDTNETSGLNKDRLKDRFPGVDGVVKMFKYLNEVMVYAINLFHGKGNQSLITHVKETKAILDSIIESQAPTTPTPAAAEVAAETVSLTDVEALRKSLPEKSSETYAAHFAKFADPATNRIPKDRQADHDSQPYAIGDDFGLPVYAGSRSNIPADAIYEDHGSIHRNVTIGGVKYSLMIAEDNSIHFSADSSLGKTGVGAFATMNSLSPHFKELLDIHSKAKPGVVYSARGNEASKFALFRRYLAKVGVSVSKDSFTYESSSQAPTTTTPAVETKPNQTNEEQTEDKRDKTEGLQVGRIVKPPSVNVLTGDVAKAFLAQGGNIIVAKDDIEANLIIKEEGLEGRPVVVVNEETAGNRAGVEEAIESHQDGVRQLGSEVESNLPAIVDPLIEDPTAPKFVANISKLDIEDEHGGMWSKSGDTYSYSPAKGKVLPIGVNTVVAIDGELDAVLLLVNEKDGVYEFRKVDFKSLYENTLSKDAAGYGKLSKNWNANRLKEAGEHIEKHLEKLFGGKLSEKEFDSMLRKVMAIVAPGVKLESIVFAPLENGEFFVARRTNVVSKDVKPIPAKEDRKLDSLGNPVIQMKVSESKKPYYQPTGENLTKEELAQIEANEAWQATQPPMSDGGVAIDSAETSVPHYVLETGELVRADEYVAPKPEESAEQVESTRTTIHIDRQAFMANLAKVFRGYRTGQDAFYNKLVGNEVARQLAAHVDEEMTHVVGMSAFKDIEVLELFDTLAGFEKKDKHRFISSVFAQIAARRVKGKALDAFTQDEKIMVGFETLRALNQILTTGSWTENQTEEAKRLIFALNEDAEGEKGPMKSVIELLRRYMQKIRRMLHMRYAMGQLPPKLKKMLQQQETLYVKANLFGDVDLIRNKNAADKMAIAKDSLISSRKKIGKIAMKHTEALVELKRVVKNLGIHIEDVIEIDYRQGEIRLVDDKKKDFNGMSFQDLLRKFEPDVSIDEINKGLAELEMEGAVFAIMQDLGLAYRALEAARNLSPNFLTILDDSTGFSLSEGDEEGATKDDKKRAAETERYRVHRMLVAAAPSFDNGSAFINRKIKEIDELAKKDSMILTQMNLDVIDAVRYLDPAKASDAVKMQTIARMINANLDFASPTFHEDLLKRLNDKATVNSIGESVAYDGEDLQEVHEVIYGKHQEYVPFVSTREKRREMWEDLEAFRLAQMSEAQAEHLGAEHLTDEQVASLALSREAELETLEANMASSQYGSIAQVERSRLKARRLRADASVNMEVANRLYQDYLTYTEALDNYNALATTAIKEMIGEEPLVTKEFGMSHQDLNYNMEMLLRESNPEKVLEKQRAMAERRGGKIFAEAEYEDLQPVPKGLDQMETFSIAHGYPQMNVADVVKYEDGDARLITVTYDDKRTPWFPSFPDEKPPEGSFVINALPTYSNGWYKRSVLSSASFRGRMNAMKFLQMLDRGIKGDSAERYMSTFGYVSEVVVNEDFDDVQYESIHEMLPRYGVVKLKSFSREDLHVGKNRRLLLSDVPRAFGNDLALDNPSYQGSVQSLVDSIRAYATKLQRTTNPDLIVSEIDELETLAGRSAGVVHFRAQEVLNYLAEFEAEVKKVRLSVLAAGVNSTDSQRKSFSENLFALFDQNKSSSYVNLETAIRLANMASEIARQEANSFKRIIPNVVHEKVRTARDAGYASSELFSETRDSLLDPVTLTNVKWWINRFGKGSLASVGPTFATDLLERFGRVGFGTGGALLITDAAWVWTDAPVYERDAKGNAIMEPAFDDEGKPVMEQYYDKDDLLKIRQRMTAKIKRDDGEVVTERRQIHMDMSDDEATAYLISEKDNSGHAPISNDMGDIGSSVEQAKVGRSSSESKQSPYEKSIRQMDVERQLQKKAFTEAGLFIGLRLGEDNGADEAHAYLNRLEELSNDPTGYDSVLRDGLAGLFGVDESKLDELVEKFKAFQKESGLEEKEVTSPNYNFKENQESPFIDNQSTDPKEATTTSKELVPSQSSTEGKELTHQKGDAFPPGMIVEHEIDPFSVMIEMVEFKARFERDLIDAARVGSLDPKTLEPRTGDMADYRLTEALRTLASHATAGGQNIGLREDLAAMDEAMKRKGRKTLFPANALARTNQDEAAIIAKMLHDESLGKNETYVFDANTFAKMGEQGIISTNETINLILHNIPNAIFFKPTPQIKAKNEAFEIGTRLFLPVDGSPPVIYVGETSNQTDNRALIEQALGYLTSQGNVQADRISQKLVESARTIRAALSPIEHLETLVRGLGRRSQEFDNFISQYTAALTEANPASLKDLGQAKLDELNSMVKEYFMKMESIGLIDTARKAEMNKITALLNTGEDVTDAIALIAEVWSNPESKRLLDRVMIGDNVVNTNESLSDQTIAKLVKAVNQMGESNVEDQTIGDHFDAKNSEERAVENLDEDSAEDIDNRDTESYADEYVRVQEQAAEDAGEKAEELPSEELSAEDKEEMLALSPSANNLRRFFRSRLFNKDEFGPMDAKLEKILEDYAQQGGLSPADALLFNTLMDVVDVEKSLQTPVFLDDNTTLTSGREILDGLGGFGAAPVVGSNEGSAWKGRRGEQAPFVGAWHTLMTGRQNGRTGPTLAFEKRRYQKFAGGFLDRVPAINDIMLVQADKSINEAVDKYNEDKSKNKPTFIPYPRAYVDVPLTKTVYDQIGSFLPTGKLAEAEAAVRENIQKMFDLRKNTERQRDEAKKVIEEFDDKAEELLKEVKEWEINGTARQIIEAQILDEAKNTATGIPLLSHKYTDLDRLINSFATKARFTSMDYVSAFAGIERDAIRLRQLIANADSLIDAEEAFTKEKVDRDHVYFADRNITDQRTELNASIQTLNRIVNRDMESVWRKVIDRDFNEKSIFSRNTKKFIDISQVTDLNNFNQGFLEDRIRTLFSPSSLRSVFLNPLVARSVVGFGSLTLSVAEKALTMPTKTTASKKAVDIDLVRKSAKKQHRKLINRIVSMIQSGATQNKIQSYLTRHLEGRFNALEANPNSEGNASFKDMLDELVMPKDALKQILRYDQNPATVKLADRLNKAEHVLVRAERLLAKLNDQKVSFTTSSDSGYFARLAILNTTDALAGIHTFIGNDNDLNPLGSRHKVPVTMTFVPEGALDSVTTEMNRKDKMAAYRSKWNESLKNEANPHEFYIRQQAIARALTDYAEKADVLHRAIKQHETYYNNYNPAAIIQQVTDTLSIQDMLAQDRINRLKANAKGVRYVVSPDVMAMLSIPSEQSLYSVSSVRELNELADKTKAKGLELSKAIADVKNYETRAAQAKAKGQFRQEESFNKLLAQAKIKEGEIARELKLIGQRQVELRKLRRVSRHTLPENFTERKELIAHLVNDGEWLLLGSITAEQDLKNRFVSQGKRDTGPQPRMRDIVLSSVPEEGDIEGGNIHLQNRMGFTEAYRKDAWGHTDFDSPDWALDPNSTRESAAKQFAARYSNSVVNRANWRLLERRNSIHPREGDEQRKIDTSNNFVQKTLTNFSFYVESIALAYDRNTLTGETRKRVFDFLKTVSSGTIDSSNAVAESVNLIDLYASVVTEIEGLETMKLLVSGIVPLNRPDRTALKMVHTHPSKIRMLYAKDHFAQMEARRLFGYLDHGFDMKAGRNGHKNQFEEEKKKLEESAKLLGLSSLQQSIPYVIESLRGLTKTRNSSTYSNLKMWSSDFQTGARDLKQLFDAQNDVASKQKLGKVGKWFTAEHVDIIRDYEMVKEIYDTIRPILRNVGTEPSGINKEEYANELISKAVEALQSKIPTELKIHSENYSRQLGSTFKGLSDASELTLIMMSHPDTTPDEGQAYQKWLHGGLKGDALFVSTVPLRYGHAANPNDRGKNFEPREYNADPLEEVRMTDLSLLGGVGKQARYRKDNEDAKVYRPINLNGISGTINLLDDTIYRLNVTPVYSILRKMIGKEEVNQRNQGEIVGSKIFDAIGSSPDSEIARKWRVVLGSVSEEMDIKVATDMQFGVSQTGFSETLDYLSTAFTVRALLSLLQLWQQSAPSFVGYYFKKALTGNYKDGNKMAAILSKVIASKVGGSSTFNDDAKKFVAEVATWVNFRGADGIDKLDQLRRKQVRHGAGFAKKWGGYALNQIANLGEKGLDFTIAKPERALARSIFITELMAELRFMEKNGQIEKAPESENDLISGKWPLSRIPMEAIQYAETKVSDHMGIADKANKALPFRSVTKSPIFNHIIRTGTRFSTHTATTSSGMAAMLPTLWKAEKGADGKLTVGGHRAKMEAIENIIGTVIQNSMFHAMKIKVMVPILLYIGYMFGGDDEEEAQRKAQEMADKLLAPDEEDNAAIAMAKGFVFGKKSQFFRDDKSPEAASASAYAGLTSSMLTEMFPMVHPTAVVLGFLPASDFFKKAVTNDLVQSATAKLTGLESAETKWDQDAVYIYEREAGWYETIMGWTAPTSVAYDLTSGIALAGEAAFADEASAFDIAAYLASEIIPTTRESRGYLKRKVEEPVWEQRSEDGR